MSDDFVIEDGQGQLTDDVEQMLEILIKIARSEGRDFLTYFLSMALIEARHHVPPKTHLWH